MKMLKWIFTILSVAFFVCVIMSRFQNLDMAKIRFFKEHLELIFMSITCIFFAYQSWRNEC